MSESRLQRTREAYQGLNGLCECGECVGARIVNEQPSHAEPRTTSVSEYERLSDEADYRLRKEESVAWAASQYERAMRSGWKP